MEDLIVRPYKSSDSEMVISTILEIQRNEFGIEISIGDQPDLNAIQDFYQVERGQFWIALLNNSLVGTLGLKTFRDDQAALRKMFVARHARGPKHRVAETLLNTLVTHAQSVSISEVFLGTTAKFVAAHRFYEKHGFEEIAPDVLPSEFPRMAVDSRFYRRRV